MLCITSPEMAMKSRVSILCGSICVSDCVRPVSMPPFHLHPSFPSTFLDDRRREREDNASASSGSDQGPPSRQHTMVSFLKPVLKQIIMAGKSMQLLRNLRVAESATCPATARGGSLPRACPAALGCLSRHLGKSPG